MPPVGFEPTISAGERPQTYVLDRAATGTGTIIILITEKQSQFYRYVNQLKHTVFPSKVIF